MDQDIRPILEKRFLQDKAAPNQRLRFKNYLYIQLGICTLILTVFTYYFDYLELYDKVFVLSLVIITLINCGALLEQRKWIYYLEYARLAMISTYFLYEEDLIAFFFVPIAVMIFAEQLFSLSKIYQNTILQLESVE
ncbi:hypothetical protein D3C72_614250 [compost metagenome]